MPSANGSSFMLSVRSRNGSTAMALGDLRRGWPVARGCDQVVGQRADAEHERRAPAATYIREPASGAGDAAGGASTCDSHRSDEPIAEPRHGDDVRGLLRVVAEQAAQCRDCLVDGIRRDDHARPDLAQQRVDADDLAGTLGETEQQPHRARFQPDAFLAAGDFAGQRVHEPVADAQGFRGRVRHRRATIAPATPPRTAFRASSERFNRVSGLRRLRLGIVRRPFTHRSRP